MMFASKTPRDLNHDPKPWRGPGAISTRSRRATQELYLHGPGVFDPRPEFDHVQHNAPNPILIDARSARQAGHSYSSLLWSLEECFDDAGHYVSLDWGRVVDTDVVDHARLVIKRLARIEERGGES